MSRSPEHDAYSAPPAQTDEEAEFTTHPRHVPVAMFIAIGVAVLVVFGTVMAVVISSTVR